MVRAEFKINFIECSKSLTLNLICVTVIFVFESV